VMWVPGNKDEYPLPSRLDRNDVTVPEPGEAKDTTANIMAIMVHSGIISPEMLVSPHEVNPKIRVIERYEYDSPRGVAKPELAAQAYWDPKLSADFTSREGGHVSYAHLLPFGERRARWANTFVATEAVLGSRGPEIVRVEERDGRVVPMLAEPGTLTFRMHRPWDRWQGHVAFNDNHVEFLSAMTSGKYRDAAGRERPDFLHFDEPDDATGVNHFLGIFIRAGERREDWRGIWD
jgi:hypothetical protein